MKLLSFFLVLLIAGFNTVSAADFSAVSPSGHTIYYNILDATTHTLVVTYPAANWTGYTKPTGTLIIPDTVSYLGSDYIVTVIGEDAFNGCSGITAVTLPNTLIVVEEDAFYDCHISNLTIPNSVKRIYSGAFTRGIGASINNLYVPDEIEYIQYGAFPSSGNWISSKPAGIVYLGKIAYCYKGTFAQNATLVFAADTRGISSIRNIIHPDYYYPERIDSIVFPDSLRYIDFQCFKGCSNLHSINLPNSLQRIGAESFYGCGSLTQVTIPVNVNLVERNAFSQCGNLTTVYYNATNASTTPYNYVFNGCENFTTANIGNNVYSIPSNLFANCNHLANVSMSEFVTKINSSAFANTAITSFTIPRNLDSIGSGVFSGCSSLQTIYYNAIDCHNAPNSQLFSGASNIANIIWGNDVQTIPNYLCQNMTSLQGNLNLPNSVIRIGTYAFYGCTGITGGLTLPSNLNSIGSYAFNGCSGITGNLVIPNQTHHIGSSAFSNCNNINSLTIGMNLDTMQYAFSNMSGLVSVQYNATNCQNGQYAFQNDQQLSSINFGNNVQSIPDNTIISLPNITSITLHEGLARIGQFNFSSMNISGIITLPSTLQELGYFAFSTCGNPTQIVCNAIVPPTVTTMNGYSFIFVNHYNVPLLVPCESIESYNTAQGWNAFNFINGIGDCGYNIEASANNSSMGYVQGGGIYNQGETCTLTAIPYNGNRFDHWQDGNTDNPRIFTVSSNATYIAYFVSTQGIDDINEEEIRVYSQSNCIIVEGTNETVTVFDLKGRSVNNDNLPLGVYMVKIGNHPARKVVVMR